MKDLIKKIFNFLGLATPDEEVSSDDAIERIARRMDEMAQEDDPSSGLVEGRASWIAAQSGSATLWARSIAAVINGDEDLLPAVYAEAAGLPQGSTITDFERWVAECKERHARDAELFAFGVDRLVDEALVADKILPGEEEMLRGIAAEHGLAVATFFIEYRPAQFRELRERLVPIKSTVEIDEETHRIMRQLGVTEERFFKYNDLGVRK